MPADLNHGLNRFKPEDGLNLPTLVVPTQDKTHNLCYVGHNVRLTGSRVRDQNT